jgi:ABC-type multidrug transport system, ATPase and permease components
LDLVTGLLRPSKGKILLKKNDSGSVNFEKFRENISYVGQDVTIKDGTILENISLGSNTAINPNLITEIQSVLTKVRLQDFKEENKDGIYYQVGENGSNLSGGQVQRLLLARALFRKPSILILDEATSSLDTKTDKQINEVLKDIKGQSTIILVTHKLNNLDVADKVVFLKDGRLCEFGTLEELMANDGEFRKFYEIHESQK